MRILIEPVTAWISWLCIEKIQTNAYPVSTIVFDAIIALRLLKRIVAISIFCGSSLLQSDSLRRDKVSY
jgi:hypothetical protein